MRLGKYLAHAGVASRRGAEKIVFSGRVTVGGEVVTDPARDVDDSSGVAVDGSAVGAEPTEVWMLNKPKGVTSTAREPGRRRAVVDLVRSKRRLYPVGRLDVETTGLILLTNDGALANRLTHPRYEVPKTYRASLTRPPDDIQMRKLRQGVTLEDGPTAPARVRRSGDREIEITLREGRNRQVRRMLEAVGNRVDALERIRVGTLQLRNLAEGDSRRLTDTEVKRLWKDAASVEGAK